jgi:hypothetical protein
MDSDNRDVFDELVCALKLAADALVKPNLTQAERKQISERIAILANLMNEFASMAALPFDAARAIQIREKIKEITEVIDMLVEKSEAL